MPKLTPEDVISKLTGLTDSSRDIVVRYVHVLVKQNPKASSSVVQKIAQTFKLLKFRGGRALKDPDEKGMYNDACEELLQMKLDEDNTELQNEEPATKKARMESVSRARSEARARSKSRSNSVVPPSLFRSRSRSCNRKATYMPAEFGVENVATLFKTDVLKPKKYSGPKRGPGVMKKFQKKQQELGTSKGIKRKGRSMSRGPGTKK